MLFKSRAVTASGKLHLFFQFSEEIISFRLKDKKVICEGKEKNEDSECSYFQNFSHNPVWNKPFLVLWVLHYCIQQTTQVPLPNQILNSLPGHRDLPSYSRLYFM